MLAQNEPVSPGEEIEVTKDRHLTTLQTRKGKVSEDLNHLIQRDARGRRWMWKKVTVVVDSGAAENVMVRCTFSEISMKEIERCKSGDGVQRIRRSAHKELRAAGLVRQNS